jgi:hypothetical protein
VTSVTLTSAEIMQAAMVGSMRQATNLRDGRRDADGFEGEGWSEHIEGAAGECAVAKALGVFWSGRLGILHEGDVRRIEVRTRSREDYQLILKRRDPDDRQYVLVRGKCPSFTLVGWCWGHEGKRDEYWADPAGKNGKSRPNYFVPDCALRPMSELGL